MTEDILKRYGFNDKEFARLQERYRTGKLSLQTNVINYDNSWEVSVPRPEDSAPLPPAGGVEGARGKELISENKLALILMNGGAATRFQKPGENLPKGAFRIMEVDGRLRSFMELKLANARWAEREYGGRIPVWILNSYFTDDKTRSILMAEDCFGKAQVFTYCQGIMKRVVPSEDDLDIHYGKTVAKLEKKIAALPPGGERSSLEEERKKTEEKMVRYRQEYRGRAGEVIRAEEPGEEYNPPGHLDTTLWLVLDRNRPLLKMVELGVEYIMISNIDNLGATVDPALPGLLAFREEAGIRILCEVSSKPPGQKGGALARVYDPAVSKEWVQLIEEFAFPPGFDQDRIPEFNNASYTVSVSSLLRTFELDREKLGDLKQEELVAKVKRVTDRLPVYVAIKELKEASGDVRPVIQFERLQGDLTRLLPPLGVKTTDRFFPVKKREDIPIVTADLERILAGKLIL